MRNYICSIIDKLSHLLRGTVLTSASQIMESALPFHPSRGHEIFDFFVFHLSHSAHSALFDNRKPHLTRDPNHKNSHPCSEGYVLIPPSHVTTAGSRVPLLQCKTSGKFEPPSSSRRPQETNKCPCYLRFVTRARSLFSLEDSAAHKLQLPWETWRSAQWEQKC